MTSSSTMFGKYQLLGRIASGAHSEVFKARLEGLGGVHRTFAIKRILPHLSQNGDYIAMLVDEAKVAGLLSHANIAQVLDLGRVDGIWYIAMEFVDGCDLSSVIREARSHGRTIPVPHAVFVAQEVLKALEYAHQRAVMRGGRPVALKIIHRDISPSNILLSHQGEVKLTDFGIARASLRAISTLTAQQSDGSFDYMSPEQALGAEDLDQRSDIFMVGTVLYEMLCGKPPFRADNELATVERLRNAQYVRASELNPNVPPPLESIINLALQVDRTVRYQHATAFKESLARFNHEAGLGFTKNATLATYLRALVPRRPPAPLLQGPALGSPDVVTVPNAKGAIAESLAAPMQAPDRNRRCAVENVPEPVHTYGAEEQAHELDTERDRSSNDSVQTKEATPAGGPFLTLADLTESTHAGMNEFTAASAHVSPKSADSLLSTWSPLALLNGLIAPFRRSEIARNKYEPEPRGSESQETTLAPDEAAMLVSLAPDFGTVVVLMGRQTYYIGRGVERNVRNKIVLDHPEVSRRHCVLDWQHGTYRVRDTGSSSGTTVNGMRVLDFPLQSGDEIIVAAQYRLVFITAVASTRETVDLQELRTELCHLIPEEEDIRIILADAGIDAANIRFGSAAQTWFSVLALIYQRKQDHRSLVRLLRLVSAGRVGRVVLERAIERLEAAASSH